MSPIKTANASSIHVPEIDKSAHNQNIIARPGGAFTKFVSRR